MGHEVEYRLFFEDETEFKAVLSFLESEKIDIHSDEFDSDSGWIDLMRLLK